MNETGEFCFCTERRLVLLTGREARNLPELLGHMREVPGSSIFYHTHHRYLSHHFERPAFHNDFALWASRALLEERLAEKLAALNLLEFASIRQLREALIGAIEVHLGEPEAGARESVPGDEFHFCESQSFILPTGIACRNVEEFFTVLQRVSTTSLYFHFFEARLRLERPTNDFSRWMRDQGEHELAQAIDDLDPYGMTLEGLRDAIIRLGPHGR